MAGIYGMNFKVMPELEWAWGYPASLVAMFVLDVYLWFKFKRTGWL
ncbi:MAG TPA: CorA family divalent cation transporter [Usitatibacter sp.]